MTMGPRAMARVQTDSGTAGHGEICGLRQWRGLLRRREGGESQEYIDVEPEACHDEIKQEDEVP